MCDRSILKPLDKEIKRALQEESVRQTKAYGKADIAASLAEQAAEEEQKSRRAGVAEEKESHPEDPVFKEDQPSDIPLGSDPKQWTALEDAALIQYVQKNQAEFDKDPRAGVFWRKAEKEITTVHRTWTQMKIHYLSDLMAAAQATRESKREAKDVVFFFFLKKSLSFH